MRVIVTVCKSEFVGKELIRKVITGLSSAAEDIEDAYIYIPRPGTLMEFLTILSSNKIAYRTHFDPLDGPETSND